MSGSERGVTTTDVVVVIGPVPPPFHGASVVQSAVTKWLRSRAVTVVVVDTSARGHTGVLFHLVRLARHVRGAIVLAQLRSRAPSVYITGAGGLGLWYQLGVVLTARMGSVPVVFHHHSYAYLNNRALPMRLLTWLGRDLVTHVALSRHMADRLSALYPAARSVAVCSNAAVVEPIARAGRQEDSAIVHVGHLSNLSVEKGLEDVIQAHEGALAAGLDVRLHLAGPTADRTAQMILTVARAAHPETIIYHGRLERSELAAFFGQVDIFHFPSAYRNEAEPMVILEALTAGVPVLASSIGCLSDALLASEWPAVEDGLFQSRSLEVARLVAGAGAGAARSVFLRKIAGSQLDGFRPRSMDVILTGLAG